MLLLTPAKNAVEVLPGYFTNLQVRPATSVVEMQNLWLCTVELLP